MKTTTVTRDKESTTIEINEIHTITKKHETFIFYKYVILCSYIIALIFSLIYFSFLLNKFETITYAARETSNFLLVLTALFTIFLSKISKDKVLEKYFRS